MRGVIIIVVEETVPGQRPPNMYSLHITDLNLSGMNIPIHPPEDLRIIGKVMVALSGPLTSIITPQLRDGGGIPLTITKGIFRKEIMGDLL